MKKFLSTLLVVLSCSLLAKGTKPMTAPKDDYLWLEGITDTKALDWVKALNEKTINHFKQNPLFNTLEEHIAAYRKSDDRIPYVGMSNNIIYNYWTDAKNPKGLWRRTSLEKYLAKEDNWEIILDIDLLSKTEQKEYVYRGCTRFNTDSAKCLVKLSNGGKDAIIMREFDLEKKTFVTESDAFIIPEAKGNAIWLNDNQLFVVTDFGKGTMNSSGYPRVVKIWNRGTPLTSAQTIFKAAPNIFYTDVFDLKLEGQHYFFIATYFGDNEVTYYFYKNNQFKKINIPTSAFLVNLSKEGFFFTLKKDFQKIPSGSVINVPFDSLFSLNKFKRDLTVVFSPGQDESSGSIGKSKNHLYLGIDKNVVNKVYEVTKVNNIWTKTELLINGKGTENLGNVAIYDSNNENDILFLTTSGYISPNAFYYFDASKTENPKKMYELPQAFNSSDYQIDQLFATSADGTQVPYFVVHKKDIKYDGKNPTIQYGYGGFEITISPAYLGGMGKTWLERGGIYVMAHIRGGGEFGPTWHRAAILKNRHKAFEDFYAVSKDLITKKITSSDHLGIWGGSNGGLLVATMMTRHPDLYKAVVCDVPITDMMRYNKLLAGASWMDEYGDPAKKDMHDYLLTYSPYHNLKAEKKYPEIFFLTSTKDDRVHPAHARKMAAKMKEFNHNFYYYENTEGGHAGSSDLNQFIFKESLIYTYLNEKLF